MKMTTREQHGSLVKDRVLQVDVKTLLCLYAAFQLCHTKAVMMNQTRIPPHQHNTWPRQFIKHFIAA